MSEATHCANCGAEVPVDKPHRLGECHRPPVTLTEFLLARIAEDKSKWRRVQVGRVQVGAEGNWTTHDPACDFPGDVPGVCTCDLIARLLADCAAKRQIVEAALAFIPTEGSMAETALYILATVYADHPDYRDEWRP